MKESAKPVTATFITREIVCIADASFALKNAVNRTTSECSARNAKLLCKGNVSAAANHLKHDAVTRNSVVQPVSSELTESA